MGAADTAQRLRGYPWAWFGPSHAVSGQISWLGAAAPRSKNTASEAESCEYTWLAKTITCLSASRPAPESHVCSCVQAGAPRGSVQMAWVLSTRSPQREGERYNMLKGKRTFHDEKRPTMVVPWGVSPLRSPDGHLKRLWVTLAHAAPACVKVAVAQTPAGPIVMHRCSTVRGFSWQICWKLPCAS